MTVSLWYVWSMWYECANMICMEHKLWMCQYDIYGTYGLNALIWYVIWCECVSMICMEYMVWMC